MSVFQTAISLVFNIIGVVSFTYVAIVVYLMYTDPYGLEVFMNTTQMLLDDALAFINNINS